MLHTALASWSTTVTTRPRFAVHALVAAAVVALTALLTVTTDLPPWLGALIGGVAGGGVFAEIYALGSIAHSTNRHPFARWWELRSSIALSRRRWIATWVGLTWFAFLVFTQPSPDNPLLGMITCAIVLSLWTFASARADENDTQWESLDAATRKLRGRTTNKGSEPPENEPHD